MKSTPMVVILVALLLAFIVDGIRSGAELSAQVGPPPGMREIGQSCEVHVSGTSLSDVTLKSIDPDWVVVMANDKRYIIPKENVRWIEVDAAGG